MRDVSVCIPCYNEGPYVEAAVRSIVRQTAYDRIREIIVVDDGSTDDTRQRIQGLRDAGIALTYIATSNAGPSTARNRALKEANGEFIAFLDGDDLWSPDKTERQLAEFDHPDVGLVYSDYIDFEDASLDDGILMCVRRLDKHGQALVADFYLNDGPIFPSAAILRREVYDRIGGFDERFRMAEDTDYWLRVALAGYRFRHVPGGLLCKRRHKGNLTHDLERWLGVFEEQTSAYAAIHPFLAPLAKRRLSRRYARIGQSLLANRRIARGLSYLRKALLLDWGNARAWSYVVALPLYAAGGSQVVGEIKRAYHLMRSRAEAIMRDVHSRERSARGERLHVVMVLPTYLPESFGGAEQQCRKLSHALSRRGVRVTILAPRLLSATPRIEQDGNVSIRRFRVPNAPNLGGRYGGSLLLWSAGVLTWLWTHRSTVDVVHIFHGRLHALPVVIGGALLGKPNLVKIGRGGEHFDLSLVRGKRLLGRGAYRALLKNTTGYVANSQEIVNNLLAHNVPHEQIFIVPNGVEVPDIISSNERGPTEGPGPAQCVYLGRLDSEKCVDLMLKGFARLSDHSTRLTIVGEGKCRIQLERLASELGLQGRVVFPGRTDDVSKFLRSAHFYLSTSASEGMSNALLEAMSFGLVPLVSDVSGARDIVDRGRSGFLFEAGDLDDFVAKLELLLRTTATNYRVMSNAARKLISQRFGIERIADRHLHIYRTVSDRSTSPCFLPVSRSEAAASSRPPARSNCPHCNL